MADEYVVPVVFDTSGAESAFGSAESAASLMGQSVADATAKGQAGLHDVGDEAKSAGEELSKVDELAKTLLETLGAYEGLHFLEESVSKAEEFQATLRQITASITATGDASGVSAGQMQEIADQIEATSNFSHEAALQAENLLTNFKAIKGEDTFARVTQDVADLAAKMGRDMPAAALQLGRVIETGTVTSLQRIGVVFSDTEKASIKSMHAMGDEAGVLEVVLAGVESVLEGQAAAQRGTGESAQALKNDIDAFMEVLGGAMIPAVREISGEIADWLKGNEGLAASLGGELGTAIKTVGELVLWMAQNWDLLSVAVGAFVGYKVASMVFSLAEAISAFIGIETAASIKAAELAAAEAAEAEASAAAGAALVELVPVLAAAAGAMERTAAATLALATGMSGVAAGEAVASAGAAQGAVIYDAYGVAVGGSAVASDAAATAAGAHAAAVVADAAATEGATVATKGFTASLLANPLTAVLVGVAALGVAIHNYTLEVDAAYDATLRELEADRQLSEFLDQFGSALDRLRGDWSDLDTFMELSSKSEIDAARRQAQAELDKALAAETGAAIRVQTIKTQIAAIELQIAEEKKLAESQGFFSGYPGEPDNSKEEQLSELQDQLVGAGTQMQKLTSDAYALMAVLDKLGEGGPDPLKTPPDKGAEKLAEQAALLVARFNEVTSAQNAEADAIGLSASAYNDAAAAAAGDKAVLQLLAEAQKNKTQATQAEVDAVWNAASASAYATQENKTAQEVAKSDLSLQEERAKALAKVSDAMAGNNTESTIATAVAAAETLMLGKHIDALGDDGQHILANARLKAEATVAGAGEVAQIQEGLKARNAQAAAEAAYQDALSQTTNFSRANALAEAAENQARKEGLQIWTPQYAIRIAELVLDGQELQATKDKTANEQALNAIRQGALQTAESQSARLAADVGLYAEINPQIGALAQGYQSLFTAEGFVTYQEDLLQVIRKRGLDLSNEIDQAEARRIAASLAGISQQIQAYGQLNAQLQQLATDEKAVADSISKDWDTMIQSAGEAAVGLGVTWKSVWQGMEKQVVDSVANMVAHMAESSLLQGIFGQGSTLQTVLFGGGPSGTATAQFQTAVTRFGGFVDALTGGNGLFGSSGSVFGDATGQLKDSVVFLKDAGVGLKDSADAESEFASFASGAFGANSKYFTDNSGEFNLAALALDHSAASLAASGGSGGSSGLLGDVLKLFGGGGTDGLSVTTGSALGGSDSFFMADAGAVSVNADAYAAAGSSFGTAAGGAMMGMLYGGAIAFAGWVVGNVISGFLSQPGPDPNTTFGQGMTFGGVQTGPSYNTAGGNPSVGLGAAGASLTAFDQQSQQVVQGLQQFFEGFEKATGQIIQSLPAIAIQVSENGLMFKATVGNTIIGTFTSMQSAIDHAIAAAFSVANLGNLPKVIQDYVKGLSGAVDPSQILGNVQILKQVIDGAHGAVSQITTDMANFGNTAISENIALVNMGLSLSDLGTMLGDVNSGIVALDEKERDSIEGKKLTAKQQQQLDMETYNNALTLQEAQVRQQIIQLQVEALGIAGQGAYINGLGLVATATVDAAGIQAKSAGVIDGANKVLLDSINAAIQSDQDLLKQLDALYIKPGDLKNPGGSAASTATTLASAAQTLAQALLALAQSGLPSFAAGLLKIEDDTAKAEKGLKANSAAYKDLEAAEQAQIELLKKQTQATTDATVVPLVEQARGMSAFAISLGGIHKQFDEIYQNEKDLGAGSAELHRVRLAELQDEHNLVMQTVGALSLPLDTTATDAKKFTDAIEALRTGLSDGAISAAEFNREMGQIAQQGTADVLTMVEGIYTAAGKTKQAELVKEQLEEIDFQIKLAQLEEETAILLSQGVITQQLANQVAGIEAFYADPANQPDWAKLNAGASSTSAAQGNLASSAQSAADALQKFIDSLRQNTALSPLTPAERVAAAAGVWQRDLALATAQPSDSTAVSNAQQAATDYLTALRDQYGSSGPYTQIFAAILAQLQALEVRVAASGGPPSTAGGVPISATSSPALQEQWVRFASGMEYELPVGSTLPPGAVWISGPGGQPTGAGSSSQTAITPQGKSPAAPDPGAAAQAAAAGLTATANAGQAAATALSLIAAWGGGAAPPGAAGKSAAAYDGLGTTSPWGAIPPLSPSTVLSVRIVAPPPQGNEVTADGRAVVSEIAAFREQQRAEAAILAARVADIEQRQAELTRALSVVSSNQQRAGRAA